MGEEHGEGNLELHAEGELHGAIHGEEHEELHAAAENQQPGVDQPPSSARVSEQPRARFQQAPCAAATARSAEEVDAAPADARTSRRDTGIPGTSSTAARNSFPKC